MRPLDPDTANLLRATVRPRKECDAATLCGLVAKVRRWEEAIDGAQDHGVLPMLYSSLSANTGIVPAKAMEYARKKFERNAFHCLANAAELLEVLEVFGNAGIEAMPFKGVVLGATAYGDMTARGAGDLDLMIHYRDLRRATTILKERGYELKSKVLEDGSPALEDYFEFHFERPSDGMVLELRWRLELIQSRYRHDAGMDWAWPRRRTAKLAGAEVPNFDPVTSLLVLCMHGSKHVWSRLVWICDVAKLLESEPGLDWEFAEKEAKQAGLWRSVALGVLLARRIAGANVPSDVLQRFEGSRAIRNVAQFLDENMLEEPGKMPEGWIPYNIRILGFRDRARAVLSPAFLRPNARDRSFVKLPKLLEPLYFLIRPVRILLDRTGR